MGERVKERERTRYNKEERAINRDIDYRGTKKGQGEREGEIWREWERRRAFINGFTLISDYPW